MSTSTSSTGDRHAAPHLIGAGSALAELAGLLLSTDSFEGLLQGVAELSVRTVDPAPPAASPCPTTAG
ncbi:hypothetical protein ACVGOW_00085 [Pseudonocardia saturnea]